MKKIAVWGNGLYGKRMIDSFRNFYNGEIKIARIYDSKHAGGEISDPASIAEDFRNKMFESVFIGCQIEDSYNEIQKKLAEYQIPVFTPGCQDDFYPADTFDQTESKKLDIRQDGYEYYEFSNLLGTVHNSTFYSVMYLHNEEGKVLQNPWNYYKTEMNLFHKYDFPVNFRKIQDVIDMPGCYCILAKQFSGNYSHFLFEAMDVIMLLEEAGFTGKYVIADSKSNEELIHLFQIDPKRILRLSDFEKNRTYRFETVCYAGLAENHRRFSAPVLKKVFSKIEPGLTFDPEHKKYPARLFVKRIGSRKLLNADEFVNHYSLNTIIPDHMPLREQMNYFYNAELILSPHGANSANSLFMREGSVLVETFGRTWAKYSYIDVLREKHVHYLSVIEGPIMEEFVKGKFLDYRINEPNLYEAMDIALKLIGEDNA